MFIVLLLLMTTLYNLALAVLILQKTRFRRPGWLFASFLFWLAAWTACVAVIEYPGVSRETILFFARATFACTTLFIISCLWFFTEFPFPAIRFRRFALALTLLGIPWLWLCWGEGLYAGITQRPWNEHISVGPLLMVFCAWALAAGMSGAVNLLLKTRAARGIEREQIRYILLGFFVMVACGLLCNFVFPAITHSTKYGAYGPLSSLFISTTTAIAVLRYRLMGIRIVLRLGLIYSITIGCLWLAYTAFVLSIRQLLLNYTHNAYDIAGFVGALAVTLAFLPLRNGVQHFVNRRFFREQYDYRQTLQETSQAFASAREARVLIATLLDAITRSVQPTNAAVYLKNRDGVMACMATVQASDLLPGLLPESDPLLRLAEQYDDVLIADEMCRSDFAQQEIGTRMQGWGVAAALPLVVGKQLSGILLLGERRSGDIYSLDDISLLRILAKQSATALDNAHHYEELREVNTCLESHVKERTRQLEEANVRLAETNDALEAERAYLSTAIDVLPIPLFFHAPSKGIIHNRALGDLMQAYGVTDVRDIHVLDPDSHMPILQEDLPVMRAFSGEVTTSREMLLEMPDATRIPVLVHAGPIYVSDALVAAVVAFQDISALKAVDRAKDEFLAVLSHELKTPLTCMLAWAEVAQFDSDPEMTDKSIRIIRENALRQRALLNDLLDLSRIIHDKMVLHPVPMNLWALTGETVECMVQDIKTHDITITLNPPAAQQPVLADPDRMKQVVANLLNNAVKFTGAGGRITVTGRTEDGCAIIEVADTGRGIPEEAIKDIFAPFRQAERVDSSGGLGLGLAIVKGIVDLHRGHISAASPGPGKGSTFTLALPLAAAPIPEIPESMFSIHE